MDDARQKRLAETAVLERSKSKPARVHVFRSADRPCFGYSVCSVRPTMMVSCAPVVARRTGGGRHGHAAEVRSLPRPTFAPRPATGADASPYALSVHAVSSRAHPRGDASRGRGRPVPWLRRGIEKEALVIQFGIFQNGASDLPVADTPSGVLVAGGTLTGHARQLPAHPD